MKINPILFKSFRVPFVFPFILIIGFILFNIYGCEIGINEKLYFKNENVEIIHEKTLWDWMQLLIVPVILFGGGIYLNKREKRKEEIERKEDRELIKIQYEESKLIEYIDTIQSLIQGKDLQNEPIDSLVITVTRIRTIALLKLLTGERVSSLFDFLKATKILYRTNGKYHFVFLFLGTNLGKVDFSECNITYVEFDHVNFSYGNFQDTNWEHSTFVECNISFVKMKKATFIQSSLVMSEFLDTDFEEADFRNSNLLCSNFKNANFKNAKLNLAGGREALFMGANFEGADLTEANFGHCDLCRTNFSNAKIIKVKLSNSHVSEAIFDHTQLDETDFKDVVGLEPDQLVKAYYKENLPILPDGIKPPLQYEEWKKKFENETLLRKFSSLFKNTIRLILRKMKPRP